MKKLNLLFSAAFVPAALLLAPCATASDTSELKVIKSKAGPSLASFELDTRGASWKAIDGQWLLVQDATKNTWLVRTGACPGLPNRKMIGITTKDKTVIAEEDSIVRLGETGRCTIEGIRALVDFRERIGTPNTVLGMERPNAAPRRPFLNFH